MPTTTRAEDAIDVAASQMAKAFEAGSLVQADLQGKAAIVTLLTALVREVADMRSALQASGKPDA